MTKFAELRKESDEQWIMKDGTKIWVNDMDEGHAKNTLRMMIRKFNKLKEFSTVAYDCRDDDWFDDIVDNEINRW